MKTQIAGRLADAFLTSKLTPLLLAAALVSGFIGEPQDTIAILVIVLLNAIIGAVQEFRAERAVAALREMAAPDAQVLRDGAAVTVVVAAAHYPAAPRTGDVISGLDFDLVNMDPAFDIVPGVQGNAFSFTDSLETLLTRVSGDEEDPVAGRRVGGLVPPPAGLAAVGAGPARNVNGHHPPAAVGGGVDPQRPAAPALSHRRAAPGGATPAPRCRPASAPRRGWTGRGGPAAGNGP